MGGGGGVFRPIQVYRMRAGAKLTDVSPPLLSRNGVKLILVLFISTIHTKKGAHGLKNAAVERRRAAALSYHAD